MATETAVQLIKPVTQPIAPYFEALCQYVNAKCAGLEPWQVVAYSSGITVAVLWSYDFLFQPDASLKERTIRAFFRMAKRVPYIKNKIKEEMEKNALSMEASFHEKNQGQAYIQRLPNKGLNEEEVLKELQTYQKLATLKWAEGACSGTVYSGEEKLTELMAKVYGQFAWTNPLHADVFPDIRKMEAEVVRMTCTMFNGGPRSCGCMTSGGTESIMLACKSYRDMAYEKGIKYPEMVVPITAHAAFDKAAECFRIRIKHIPVDPVTSRADVAAMCKAINRNTCMLAGSAPSFPHGVMDPIVDIAQLGLKYKIPVHVDSCLGGFVVPFMAAAGYRLRPFDFSVPGVTSISADTHKYGYAPKGSSVIMYSDGNYRKYQYFSQPNWPGGIYGSPTFAGSRPGAIIAACWATMMYFGEQGYVESTKKIIATTRYIEAELRKIPHIYICGIPEVSVVGLGSNDFNIYRLTDALAQKGWNLNPLQYPSGIHLCCTLVHTKEGIADRFLEAVRECVTEIMKTPQAKNEGQAALYGMAQSVPDRGLVSELAGAFFDGYYSTNTGKTANGAA